MSALLTPDYLKERAPRGKRAVFERVVRKVPSRRPLPGDDWAPVEAVKTKQRLQPAKPRRRTKARKDRK